MGVTVAMGMRTFFGPGGGAKPGGDLSLQPLENLIEPFARFEMGEEEGQVATLLSRIAIHDFERGADVRCEVDFIDDQQAAALDAGSAFAGNFVSARHIDDVN